MVNIVLITVIVVAVLVVTVSIYFATKKDIVNPCDKCLKGEECVDNKCIGCTPMCASEYACAGYNKCEKITPPTPPIPTPPIPTPPTPTPPTPPIPPTPPPTVENYRFEFGSSEITNVEGDNGIIVKFNNVYQKLPIVLVSHATKTLSDLEKNNRIITFSVNVSNDKVLVKTNYILGQPIYFNWVAYGF